MTEIRRSLWIDAAKTVAIIGVVFQHLWGWAYDDEILYNSVFYAVGLFVMIGGYNAYVSFLRKGSCSTLKRIMGILIPYVVATAVYVAASGKGLIPSEYALRLIHFDACAPMYYVAVYIWLAIATPVLARLLKWSMGAEKCAVKIVRTLAGMAIVVIVSDLCTRYTDCFGIILGGGMVLAGPWLMFHYVGMCVKGVEHEILARPVSGSETKDTDDNVTISRKTGIALLMILSVSLLIWEYLFVVKGFNRGFGAVFGYGDILLTWFGALEVLLMLLWFVTAEKVIGSPKEPDDGSADSLDPDRGRGSYRLKKLCMDAIGLLGRHSLYIFLYHILFLRLYVDHLLTRMLNISHLLNRICLIFTVFAGPVIISVVIKRLRTLIFSK